MQIRSKQINGLGSKLGQFLKLLKIIQTHSLMLTDFKNLTKLTWDV